MKIDEKIIYNSLVKNLNQYSLSEKTNKFVMNFELFKLFRDNADNSILFVPETSKEILKKKKIYGYIARIPIIVSKNITNNFLIINFSKNKNTIIDLEIDHIDKNEGLFLLQDFKEHIKDFFNIDLAEVIKDDDVMTYNILHSDKELLIGKLTLFNKEIEECFNLKSERIVYHYKNLKVERVVNEIEKHKEHIHKVDANISSSQGITFELYCFSCRKYFGTKDLSKEDWKNIPKEYHTEKNRRYIL